MTKVLNWQKSDDVRDIVHLGVQALAEGQVIAMPTCTTYVAAAMATYPQSVANLKQILNTAESSAASAGSAIPPAALVLRDASELLDFNPDACPTACRLARRAWPGPTQLLVPGRHVDSLLRRLPQQTLDLVTSGDGFVRVCRPAHASILEIVRLSAGPVVALPLQNARESGLAVSADAVAPSVASILIDGGPTKYQGRPTILKISDNNCAIAQSGITPLEELQSLSRLFVLFVCTGNTCRSPMAEKLLESKVNSKDKPQTGANVRKDVPGRFVPILAMSAGISAGGGPASPLAITVLGEMGLDLKNHESCAISEKEIESADLILAMTRNHLQAIISRWPTAAKKALLLHPDGEDVSDPYGGPVSMYRDSAQKISSYLDVWVQRFSSMPLPKWLEG